MASSLKNLTVLYEDNHLIAINKRVGDIVQGDKTGDKPLSEVVKDYIKCSKKKQGNVFLGTVHRIDRPVSGIVVFSKTSKSLSRMNQIFAEGNIKKQYLALVEGLVEHEENKLEHWLTRNSKQNKSYAQNKETTNSKKAILSYRVIQKLDRYSLLDINLETGRHHQIRTQLSYIGYPIKGDLKYGAKRSLKNGGICLHAHQMSFVHPVKNTSLTLKGKIEPSKEWGIPIALKID